MLVDNLMFNEGPSIYYTDSFRNVLEDHMTYLRDHLNTTTITVDPGKAYQYEADLFGLLLELNVLPHLHWVIMRVNKLTAPMDYTPDMLALKIPNASVIDKIRQSHMTSRKVT